MPNEAPQGTGSGGPRSRKTGNQVESFNIGVVFFGAIAIFYAEPLDNLV
jgi:hypothetical protein